MVSSTTPLAPASRLRVCRRLALALALVAGCAGVHTPGVSPDEDAGPGTPDLMRPDVYLPEAPGQHFEAAPDRPPDPDACADPATCRVGCGNGMLDPGLDEACDDGNAVSMDGCSADCHTIEKDYACPMPGQKCIYLVMCGDGKLGGKETCDDGNTTPNDGCSATCELEAGWSCPQPGHPCEPRCGDAILTAGEQCDPPNEGKGCSAGCKVEPGYVCDPPPAKPVSSQPAKCKKTVCGDNKREGSEACDDGNVVDGDGCSAACSFEPDCTNGVCVSKCGDGMKLMPEACDDGNTKEGDGCSATCTAEAGFMCMDTAGDPPAQLNLKVTYRDFLSFPTNGSGLTRHPDFEAFWGDDITPLLVKPMLGPTGKPVMDGRCTTTARTTICPKGQQLTTMANFDQWYRDTDKVNISVPGALLLPRLADGSYQFDSAKMGFFPIDGKGWTATPVRENTAVATENDGKAHDFGFTSEIHYFFQYRGGEILSFSGDDDVWIFVNRQLALDLGGMHPQLELTLDVDANAAALGLTPGGLYEIALFHAERHTAASNFKLTLTGFAPTSSTCGPMCGDGVVVPPEQCDLGADNNTGGYNGCTAECRHGPSCGDGVKQEPEEQCDDGVNMTLYGPNGMPGCAPGCVLSGTCGDAKVDSLFGEQCDLGADMNTGAYNGCAPSCLLGPRCGDMVVQADHGEECDDGGTLGGDGCSHDCKIEIIP